MSKVYADKIEPRNSNADVTIGTSSNTVTLAGNDIRVNTVKDSGGNTLWVSDGAGNITSGNTILTGSLKLLRTQTGNNSASISFKSGIDSTYDVYVFKFLDINPTEAQHLQFQGNASGQTGFNEIIHSSYFKSYLDEGNSAYAIAYDSGGHQTQATGYQSLCQNTGHDADQVLVGELYLFAPSSTTFVKHFYAVTQYSHGSDYAQKHFIGGYFNVTAPISEIDFKMSSGNFDGTIKMYGLL